MITLFTKYASEGKIAEAIMIGQNMVNKNPGEKYEFEAYFDYLCKLAEQHSSLDERKAFLSQANTVLSFYVDNTTLDEDAILTIGTYQDRINKISDEIQSKAEDETRKVNDIQLMRLYGLKDQLFDAKTRVGFASVLKEIQDADSLLDKPAMNRKQNEAYDELVKENTEIMSEKMREFDRKDRVEYNKKAAEAFHRAYESFKKDEGKYKHQMQLFSLVSTTLFAYDASKLFSETLIYYNHVYSYIFSKLDDEGKLSLTRYSIECERKLG